MARADQRPPRGLHHLGGLPGQRGEAGRQPHRCRCPAAAGGHRAVPGAHHLRQLRQLGGGGGGKPVMTNSHTDQRPAYECSSRRDQLTTPSCRSVAAACVDAAVAGALLNALTPGQVALALSAAGEVAGRHQRASRAAELTVERARYDADRAERALCAVEPENRLVARSLEARWEARLAALSEAEQALQAAQDTLPPLPSRAELEKLAADLPALWNAPTTSARDRKRLLRTLIEIGRAHV